MDQVSVLEVLDRIEALSEFKFFIDTRKVDTKRIVSIKGRQERIKNILDKLFSDTDVSYRVYKKQIILKVKPHPIIQNVNLINQQIVTGTVVDEQGVPLPGVSVLEKGTQNGVSTDFDGNYTLTVRGANSVLVFSYVGYVTKEEVVGTKTAINVKMAVDQDELDEVMVVAFAKQKKSSVLASITTIQPSELKVPSSNLTTALAGRMAGIISYQRSGEPGQDNASFFIRGVTSFGYKVDPLILIDGVESTTNELAQLSPDDIQAFSIMKDATATSLYGARGANGVILVTTKEGKTGEAKVFVRFESSFSSNTKNIKIADPITYMRLENESVLTRNPSGVLPYSQNKIDNTIAGLNPYVYPANNWLDDLVKDNTSNQRVNLNVSGGGKVARYYISGTFSKDNGILKVDKRNNFNSNIDLKNYQLRSNVNIDLTKTTEAVVRLSGAFNDYRGPIDGGSGMFRKILGTNPVLFPAYYPSELKPLANHILFGNSNVLGGGGVGPSFINPYADMVKGYRDYTESNMSAQFELKQDFYFILEGLSARMLFNTERYSYFDVSRFYNPFYYSAYGYDKTEDAYKVNVLNELTGTEYLNYTEGLKSINTSTYTEVAINYHNVFSEKHEVSGLLVGTRRNQLFANQGSLQKSLPYRNQGISGRFTYGYDTRYMAELNFGYNGSERFHKSHRYGFFPSAGIGWFVSNEPFWSSLENTIPKLKLKATYGLVGNDAIGSANDRFFYLSEVNMNASWRGARFGTNYGYSRFGVNVNRYANDDISWETARKFNAGFEINLFNNLEIQADYFTENRSNILMDRAYIPTTMGLTAGVRANLGKAKSNGVDISMDYNKAFTNGLWLQGRANFTYAHSEYLFFEEPQYAKSEAHLFHKEQSLSQVWGLIAERLFIDEYDVSNAPRQNFGEYAAGDIKYRDVNGDGEITNLDRVPIGHPTVPEIIYGGGLSMGYKAFDFSFFLQGSARSSFWIDPVRTAPFIANPDLGSGSQNALLDVYANNHWSEDNRDSYALWPRLSSTLNTNNTQTSTWFMRNGAFLRLKSVELGYQLPEKLISELHLTNARIYFNGTNLLTFSGFKLWDVEMGGNGLGYPIQRVFNMGVSVNF
ncbi:TonB-dependent receptor [Snuella sp. CAU 1569]|uniref:TonB-dependent receptor n=2 Tax=Snuella sedimenti TaxID=2798802 RepID=A0A8J7IGD6_9FLAO|nr:TonB-dependent receptor [Snuella sedimenti]